MSNCCEVIELAVDTSVDPEERMTPRIKRLKEALRVDPYPVCTEKARIVSESFGRNAGWPAIVKRARAVADYLDKRTIRINPDELIVGNVASEHMGMEVSGFGPGWPDVDFSIMLNNGKVFLSEDPNEQNFTSYLRRGFLQSFEQREGRSEIETSPNIGWGLADLSKGLHCPDYAKVISTGYGALIAEAEQRLSEIRYFDADAVARADFYHAVLEVFPAAIRHANRFADEAERQARECSDPTRAAELLEIARICRKVPEHPAETFREAVQAWYFFFMLVASVTTPGGRFDQYMYPYYAADLAAGRITRAEAVELLCALRIKLNELNVVLADNEPLMAKWHNFVIGGCDRDGNEASNELTYLLIEAAYECRVPQHTLTLRVSENTPRDLIVESLRVVRTGLGLPAFINEKSYINYLTSQGVALEDARDFAIAGCMDPAIPGKSRTPADGVCLVPLAVQLAMFNGVDPRTHEAVGPATGMLYDHATFEDFYQAFVTQFDCLIGKTVEAYNILLITQRDHFPDVIRSAWMDKGMEVARDYLDRTVPFENGISINMVGMANAADALAAVKSLVYDTHKVDAETLLRAIVEDWETFAPIQHLCETAPKYGNNDAYVDEIAARLWADVARLTSAYHSIYGAPAIATGISVSTNIHGGRNTAATADGRFSGDSFADGSISPEQGKDVNGPLSMLESAMQIPQNAFAATLMNMKFSPTSLASDQDLGKLADMIRVYFANGGRQIQFNVVNKKTLIAAKRQRNKYRDLIVRVAGYSAYYTVLPEHLQDEIIKRSEQVM